MENINLAKDFTHRGLETLTGYKEYHIRLPRKIRKTESGEFINIHSDGALSEIANSEEKMSMAFVYYHICLPNKGNIIETEESVSNLENDSSIINDESIEPQNTTTNLQSIHPKVSVTITDIKPEKSTSHLQSICPKVILTDIEPKETTSNLRRSPLLLSIMDNETGIPPILQGNSNQVFSVRNVESKEIVAKVQNSNLQNCTITIKPEESITQLQTNVSFITPIDTGKKLLSVENNRPTVEMNIDSHESVANLQSSIFQNMKISNELEELMKSLENINSPTMDFEQAKLMIDLQSTSLSIPVNDNEPQESITNLEIENSSIEMMNFEQGELIIDLQTTNSPVPDIEPEESLANLEESIQKAMRSTELEESLTNLDKHIRKSTISTQRKELITYPENNHPNAILNTDPEKSFTNLEKHIQKATMNSERKDLTTNPEKSYLNAILNTEPEESFTNLEKSIQTVMKNMEPEESSIKAERIVQNAIMNTEPKELITIPEKSYPDAIINTEPEESLTNLEKSIQKVMEDIEPEESVKNLQKKCSSIPITDPKDLTTKLQNTSPTVTTGPQYQKLIPKLLIRQTHLGPEKKIPIEQNSSIKVAKIDAEKPITKLTAENASTVQSFKSNVNSSNNKEFNVNFQPSSNSTRTYLELRKRISLIERNGHTIKRPKIAAENSTMKLTTDKTSTSSMKLPSNKTSHLQSSNSPIKATNSKAEKLTIVGHTTSNIKLVENKEFNVVHFFQSSNSKASNRALVENVQNHSSAVILQYKCDRCDYICKDERSLKKHAIVHSSLRPFVCDECGQTFRRIETLRHHKISHLDIMPYKCHTCYKCFKHRMNLNRHIQYVHIKDKKFECEFCHALFSRKNGLANHYRKHTGEKPFSCDICHKNFNRRTSVTSHMKVHSKDRALFKCDVCEHYFKNEIGLKKHMFSTHNDRRRGFKCKFCDKVFYYNCLLKYHLRNHTGERPYECEICSITCTTKSRLEKHLKTHTDVRPYACEFCEKPFAERYLVVRHINQVHTEKSSS